MLHEFNLYDLFVLCFVQLVLSTILVLSPLWDVGQPAYVGPMLPRRSRLGAATGSVLRDCSIFPTIRSLQQ